jgi:hypothetical protein
MATLSTTADPRVDARDARTAEAFQETYVENVPKVRRG